MIFQELSLVPTLTVAENIFLTNEPITKGFAINKRIIQEKTSKLLKEFDIDVDPNARVSSLGVGYCQLIEIAKSLATEANILIMDEPTASLSEAETNILFNFIKKVKKKKGVSIIYISHRMNEIFKVADRITILRDGKNVITTEIDKINIQEIIEYMMGSKVEKIFEWQERDQMIDNDYILEVKELTVNSQIKDISFKLKKGEILGIAGLMGSGRTEILEAIFGIREKIKGEILIEGKRTEIKSVKDAISAGIALVPENRREQGLVLMHSVKENIILPNLQRLLHVFAINTKKVKMLVETSIKEFSIKTDSINKPVRFLSGGNQQKVVIAKWLKTNPKVLLLDEPTAGVDVGAKGEIVNIIREFANSGKGVIVVSSELAELLAVCDRILILSKGRIINEYLRKDIESEEVLQHAIQQ